MTSFNRYLLGAALCCASALCCVRFAAMAGKNLVDGKWGLGVLRPVPCTRAGSPCYIGPLAQVSFDKLRAKRGLTVRIWPVLYYIRYPTHINEPQRQLWADQRKDALESALEKYQRKKSLPTS